MRGTLPVIAILLLALISCGKKKSHHEVLSSGFMILDGDSITEELYRERDSVFHAFYRQPSNRLFIMKKAATQQELNDSTYKEEVYFASGRIREVRRYRNRRPEGKWTMYYENGRLQSTSEFSGQFLQRYESFYENGAPWKTSVRSADGTMTRSELFMNGNLSQRFVLDTAGNGSSVIYFMEGDTAEAGKLRNGKKSGIWRVYDQRKKQLHDTLYLAR